MSGCAVVVHRDGQPVAAEQVYAMLEAVPYRGLDGRAVRCFGPVGMGHAKLTVTPEDVFDQQPLVSALTGCCITADARLDNRDELLRRLPRGTPPGATDAELILRAYEAWGDDAPRLLLGDFAFAIWDPSRRRLVCARDTSGQRSLFYRADSRVFAAGSEIQQLLIDPAVAVRPNEEHIRGFLLPLNATRIEKDSHSTFYEGIYALQAGQLLVLDDHAVRVRPYWDFAPPAEVRYRHDDEYQEQYRAVFGEAVRTRLRSAYPVGAMLSGGLDSSSIVCMAQTLYRDGHAANHGFASYSYVFDNVDCDERNLISDVQAQYGFPARYLTDSSSLRWLQLCPTSFLESPTTAVSGRDTLYQAAVDDGVRVLLTGMTADAYVGGSPLVFDSLLRQARIRELWRRLARHRQYSDEPLRKTLALHCLAPLLPLELHRRLMAAYVERSVSNILPRLMPLWMPEALRNELAEGHLAQCVAEERRRSSSSTAREAAYRLLFPPSNHRSPFGWGLEFADPFADRRLQAFILGIPPEQNFGLVQDPRQYYGATKWLVRRAMRGIVPDSIRLRTQKTYFSAVQDNELQRNWDDFETAFGSAARPEIVQRGYVDHARFWARLQQMRDGGGGVDSYYLMRMVGLETWLRSLKLPREALTGIATRSSHGSSTPPASISHRGRGRETVSGSPRSGGDLLETARSEGR